MKSYSLSTVVVAVCLVLMSSALAVSPKLIAYQGRATDGSGNPVADGPHAASFSLYKVLSGGIPFWTESGSVTTKDGLFAHNLGSIFPLSEYQFHNSELVYLQVTIDGEVQSPRVQLTSAPYAFHVNSIDGSDGGIINEYLSINSAYAGDEVAGFSVNSGNGIVWAKEIDGHKWITLNSGEPKLTVMDELTGDSAVVTENSFVLPYASMKEDPDGGAGLFDVERNGGERAFMVDGNFGGHGYPIVSIQGESSTTLFAMNGTGKDCVQLPQDAVDAVEMLDEAGCGSCVNSGSVTLTQTVQNICGRTMYAPSDGYVMVTGVANVVITHTSGTISQVSFGVSDNISSYVSSCMITIVVPPSAPTDYYYYPITSHALFPISEGSKAFYFLANRAASTDASVLHTTFTELYVPTAYTTVHDPAPPDGELATPVLDPEAEQAEAEAFHNKRMRDELARIKAQVEKLTRMVSDDQ